MALLLRFSAVKVYETDLSLDVSMIETDTEDHSVSTAAKGSDAKSPFSVLDGLLSPLKSIPAKISPPVTDTCLAM